jgi:hypothetical protein
MLYRMQSDVGDGTDEDYQAGVQFCIDHRWLEPAGRDRCRATPLGIAKSGRSKLANSRPLLPSGQEERFGSKAGDLLCVAGGSQRC